MSFCCCLPRKGPLHDTLISPQPGGAHEPAVAEASEARRSISQQGLMLGHSNSCPNLNAAADSNSSSSSSDSQPPSQQNQQPHQHQQHHRHHQQQQQQPLPQPPEAQSMPQLSPSKMRHKGTSSSSNPSSNPSSSRRPELDQNLDTRKTSEHEGIELKPAESNPNLGVDYLTVSRGFVKARPGL